MSGGSGGTGLGLG